MQVTNDQLKPVVFKPGDMLFHEGDKSFHFYIIQEGQVQIFRSTEDGKKVTLAEVGEGTSIGEFAMIDRRPRSASARAKTEVKAVEVSEAAYQHLLAELPDWAVSVMKSLVERIRNANDIIRKIKEVDDATLTELASTEFDTGKVKLSLIDDDDTPDLA